MKNFFEKYLLEFRSTLLVIKSLIAQLTSVFTITEQDRLDAGVYPKRIDY